ncbi:MAG: nitroreductase family deazaflavin-dependent oxidoreductase [Actinomycetota bacterium]|nr:nitroreductase family deazaflavin-dependent oxidoreductase [Actinomycetota bacterium]
MKDVNVRRASTFHKHLFRATGGRFGKRLVDNDMLLLTTTGRSSGEDHTVPLLYLRDADRLVVIASYGGRDFHPDWYLNLVETPDVEVELPGSRATMTARTADADERAEWWSRAVEAYDGYAEYQVRTERQIPVVFLEPRI